MSLREHIQAIKREDPAAKSSLEILLCYQGLHAVCFTVLPIGFTGKGFLLLRG